MVHLPGGKLLIFGGLELNEKRSDETWIFDTTTSAACPAPPFIPINVNLFIFYPEHNLLCMKGAITIAAGSRVAGLSILGLQLHVMRER